VDNDGFPARVQLRAARIIMGAFAFGVASFALVVYFIVSDQAGSPIIEHTPTLRWALIAMSMTLLPAAFFMRGVCHREAVSKVSAEDLRSGQITSSAVFQHFVSTTIVSGAMVEAIGLFGSIVYLLSRDSWAFASINVSLVFLALLFPTRASWEQRLSAIIADARERQERGSTRVE
jgi:hypothetical protein